MRFAAAACALAIVVCVAVFGAVLAQRATDAGGDRRHPRSPSRSRPPSPRAAKPGSCRPWSRPAAATPVALAPAARPPRGRADSRIRDGTSTRHGPAPRPPRRRPRPRSQPGRGTRAGSRARARCGQLPGPSERARRLARRRDRHHRRARLRLRALQAATTSCSPARWCSPSTTAPGRTTRRRCSPRSPPTAPRRSSSRSASTPCGRPEILKQVDAAGHTIGSHTWSHKDLSKLIGPGRQGRDREGHQRGGLGRCGHPASPFFRFPALRHPPEMVTYLGERNIAIFSTDIDSFDFKIHKPEQVIASVHDQAEEERQGHRADARLPARHRRWRGRAAQAAQGRRLQDRVHEGEGAGADARRLRRDDREGRSSCRRSPTGRPRTWCARSNRVAAPCTAAINA